MAYTKQTWNNGDIITAEKLNHMEDGIASGGVMAVNLTYDESTLTYTMNKTWQEIHDAIASGTMVIVIAPNEEGVEQMMCYRAVHADFTGRYDVSVVSGYGQLGAVLFYSAASSDGYPSFTED